MKKLSKGFTLVEMLIVIAVIGILAVAVLSAINPVEQIRKGRDTRRRSNAAELLNAVERYYATFEAHPTDFSAAAGLTTTCEEAITNPISGIDLGTLVGVNELKAEFSDRVDDPGNELYAAIDADSDLVIVCYEIESEANLQSYTTGETCGTDPYYVCLPE